MRRVVSVEFSDGEKELWNKLTRLKNKHFRTYQSEIKAIIDSSEE